MECFPAGSAAVMTDARAGCNLPADVVVFTDSDAWSRKVQGVGARIVESGQAVGAVFRNRDLRRLELAAAGSIIGNWAYFVALAVYAYGQGGAAAVGLVSVIRMIPAALLAPLTSTLADRFDRKHVMIGADLVRAALMLVAAATIASDGPAALVYIVVGLSTVTSTAFRPAQSAILPGLARSPKELTAANVALSTMEATATFIGPALGGLILVLTNVQIVFAVNAASFLWSAALLLALRTTDEATLVRRRSKAGDGRKLDRLRRWHSHLRDSWCCKWLWAKRCF